MEKKVAVIPWSEFWLQDKMFVIDDDSLNFDYRNNPYYIMKQEFEKNGDCFHTVDMYSDMREIDLFLFFELDWNWLKKIADYGLENKIVYCNAEPPVVYSVNTPEGYKFIAKFFPYVMTWNDEWIDDKFIFKKNIPYYFVDNREKNKNCEKKLLTSISGNKTSTHPDELYSERARVIRFFEENYPEEFEFYGTGWNKEEHICYQGKCDKKAETYHKYKFAICFENMKNIKGYVTEKILDCLTAGIVPVYAGADNIEEYVPKNCFIDYFQFQDLNDLREYLLNMSEEDYEKYLLAADRFLNSKEIEKFSGKEYAKDVYAILKLESCFEISWKNKLYINTRIIKKKIITGVKRIGKNLIGSKK